MIKKSTNEFIKYDYYNDKNNNRLSNLLIVFALIFCPIFAYLFYYIDAPKIYVDCLLSGIVVLPLFVFLNKNVKKLNGKLPLMYLFYFIVITQFVLNDLFKSNIDEHYVIYFLCIFCLFNFSLQNFHYSIVYFVSTLLSFTYYLLKSEEENIISYNIYFIVLFICSGVFYLIIYQSRKKLIDNLEDNNYYLKNIVSHLYNGVLLIQYTSGIFQVLDYNKMIIKFFKTTDNIELSDIIEKFIDENDLDALELLNESEFLVKEINFEDKYIFEIKINKVILKKRIYYIILLEDIGQKVKEKKIILENQIKYKNLYIRNQTGLFTLNLNAEIIDCNPAFYEIFKIENYKNFNLFSIDLWKKLKEKIINKGSLVNYQYTFQKSIDENLYLSINFYYDKLNNLIEGNIVNITELTLNSKELEEKEKKYRLIYEESKDALILLADDIIVDVNKKCNNFFDLDKNEVIGKTLWDITFDQTPEKKDKLNIYFNELKKLQSVKFNWNFSNKFSFIETSVSIAPIKIGNDLYFQCVIHDETERNKYLNELKESRNSFESIIENTPEGFIIVKNNKIVFANTEFYKIFNLNKDEKIEIGYDLFGVNYEKIEKLFIKNEEGIKQKQLQFFIDKKIIDIELTIVPTIFDKEKANLMIFKDISYQNKLSKEQMRAELAEELNKRLSKEIEDRKTVERKLEMEYLRTKAIFESSENTFLITLTPDLIISSFNLQCKIFFDYQTKKELRINENFDNYFEDIISSVKLRYFRFILSSIKKGKSYQLQLKFINKINQRKWLEIYINPIFDLNGNVSEISFVAHDITEKKNNERDILQSLKEKEVLLKEVHHRVKNNLQIISSILNLQSSYISDEKSLEIIDESRHRIRTMAIIHENLYQNTNFTSINFKNYSRELLRNLISSYHFNNKINIKVVEDIELVELNLDQAIPCGLIINELITNSLKYAFKEDSKEDCCIYLELKELNGIIHLNIGDNGIGLPKKFSIEKSETLGLQLVITLVEQLDGNIKLEKSKGIKYFITFEKQKL